MINGGGMLDMKNMFHGLLSYCYFSVLKPLGWKKEGNNFRQYDDDGLCKIINFQKSRWNTSQECEFYINMGVYVEKAREIEKKKFHEYECQFRNRASSKGGTYRLNDTVDLSTFQEEIACIITDEVLVLLNNFDSREKFIKMLLSGEAQQYTAELVMHYYTCKLLCDMGFKKEILNILKDKKGALFEGLGQEIQNNNF